MANFYIFVIGTLLWSLWAYRTEWNAAWQYLKLKWYEHKRSPLSKYKYHRKGYITKDVM